MAVAPRIGTEFAGYRIEALLGRGGMSVVYRAENIRLGNKVALKLLSEELADDESFRERFVRESRTAATLNHPNIVTIYDAGDSEGLLYIAMRLVDGDLKAHLRREGPLAPDHALAIAAQVGSALDAAHARSLLHRDVKPANIRLEPGEPGAPPIAYLADFGLTKHLESRSGITASGQFVGTIDYMSPEQIEGRDVDGRTDIYSLGCVLFECLTSATPFRRETEVAVLWAHMREDPPAVTELRPELPGAVDLVVARAVAKDPANRYTTARELVEELHAPRERDRHRRLRARARSRTADHPRRTDDALRSRDISPWLRTARHPRAMQHHGATLTRVHRQRRVSAGTTAREGRVQPPRVRSGHEPLFRAAHTRRAIGVAAVQPFVGRQLFDSTACQGVAIGGRARPPSRGNRRLAPGAVHLLPAQLVGSGRMDGFTRRRLWGGLRGQHGQAVRLVATRGGPGPTRGRLDPRLALQLVRLRAQRRECR